MEKKRKLLFSAWSCHNEKYYAYQTWNAPLRKIFQEFVSFDPQEETYKYGKDLMNKRFLEKVRKENPDYIFLWLIYDEFYIETLLKIREICPKAKIINYCGDDDAMFDNYSIYLSYIIDYFFVTHKEYIPGYKNKAFLSCATNTDQFKPLDIENKYDVTFIGTPKNDRKEFIEYLMDKGLNMKIFGAGWSDYPKFNKIYGGFLNPEEYTKVINQSKINLNFTKNYAGVTHVIQRFFEINACRAFQLTEYSKRYTELFKDKMELAMFKTKEELLQKIKYYLKNEKEREIIADRAYKRVMKDFSKDSEFKRLFKIIFKEENKSPKSNFPEINNKIIILSKRDISLNDEALRDKLKYVDYIGFSTEMGRHLPHHDYLHCLSLGMYKKDISCSDYYINSDSLGDYQAIYVQSAFEDLKDNDFQRILFLDNIVVTKSYFLKNIQKFKSFFSGGKIDIINKKNTSFIRIPLSSMNGGIRIDYEVRKNISHHIFENQLRTLGYKRSIYVIYYLWMIGVEYLKGNKFMMNYLIEKGRSKAKKLMNF
ncbi:MAG: glycosyltransferase [Nanoarchaeota archaeon]